MRSRSYFKFSGISSAIPIITKTKEREFAYAKKQTTTVFSINTPTGGKLKRNPTDVAFTPNDSTRLTDETTLLATDIVVELEDHSLANVEVQKIGYSFPGQRSACYSSDMLLRQYKRVRGEMGESFSYKNIKNVYLIVIYERSPNEFKQLPDIYYHHSRQVSGRSTCC